MRADVVVPPALTTAMTAIHGDRGARWCADLPELVGHHADRWGLELEEPFEADYHWVAPGRCGPVEIVLKLGIPTAEQELHREAGVLAAWDGAGAVRLLEAALDEAEAVALLLERVRPGTDLAGMPDDEALPLLGATGRVLHSSAIARPAAALDPTALTDLRTGHPALPSAVTTAAADRLEDLLTTAAAPVLCHGDLHHGNVLLGEGGPVAIDPRGVWAEPALDVSVAMLNPLGTLPSDRSVLAPLLERRLPLLCDAMGVEVDRGRAWTAVYAVISALWTAEDGLGVEEDSLAVAAVLS